MSAPPVLPFERSHPYDVGILLVHGIGEQRKSDTLLAAGTAFVNVLRARLVKLAAGRRRRRNMPDPSATMTVELHRDEPGEPARAEILLEHLDGLGLRGTIYEQMSTSRWLIVESWWAEAFPQPTEIQVFRWMVDTLPAAVVSHFDRRLRRAVFEIRNPDHLGSPMGKYLRFARDVASLLAAMVLVPPLLVALVLLLLVGVLPIPFIDSLARALQRLLAATVGDSYVLLGNELARSAIVGTVALDLRWLAGKCDRVTVIAHSQGGAIAHAMVRADPLVPCERLITYGSGLHKLSLLEQMNTHGEPLFLWMAVAGLLVASSMLAIVVAAAPTVGQVASAAGVGVVALVVATGALIVWRRRGGRFFSYREQGEADRKLFAERFQFANDRVEWTDIYASDDPIPNGPLLDEYQPRELRTHVTHNLGSSLLDHTSYWQNHDDFVSRVARLLLETAGISVRAANLDDADRQDAATARRRWRVAWRRAGTWTAVLGTSALAWRFWMRPPAFASRAYNWVHAIVGQTPWIGDAVAPAAVRPFHSPLGVVLFVVLAVLIGALIHACWTCWNRREMAQFFDHVDYSNATQQFQIYALSLAASLLAATLYAFGAAPLYLAAVGLGTVFVVGITDRLGWSSLWTHVRNRTVAGTLDEVRSRWRAGFEASLVRNVKRGHRWSIYQMGWRQIRSKSPRDRLLGEDALRQAIDLKLSDAAWTLGDYLENKRKDFAGARDAYEKGKQLDDSYCAYCLGRLYEKRLNDPDAAIAAYREACEMRVPAPMAAHSLGLLLVGRGHLTEARRAYKHGVELHDRLSMCWLGDQYREAAEAREKRGSGRSASVLYRAAIQQYTRAIDRGVDEAAVHLGTILYKRDDPVGAIAAYDAGVQLGSDAAALALGRLFIAEHRIDEAERALRRAMELAQVKAAKQTAAGQPLQHTTTEAAFELGWLLEARGDVHGAQRLYQIAIRNPGDSDGSAPAALGLGRILVAGGEERRAERVFRRGLELGSSQAGVELGSLLDNRGETVGAADAYRRAAEKVEKEWTISAEERAAVLVAAGVFLQKSRDYDKAKQTYQAATQQGSEEAERRLVDLIVDLRDTATACDVAGLYMRSPGARLRLARFLVLEGHADRARQILSAFGQTASEYELQAAALWEELGDDDQAAWRYRNLMRAGSAEAATRLVKVLTRLGDTDGVKRALDEARIRGC